jgi:tripartite-type tricarboxylate transporter receptor subunit TctC
MPAELVKRIADEAVRAAAGEVAKAVVAQQGGDMVASSPAEFAAFIDADRTRYAAIVRDAGMTVE